MIELKTPDQLDIMHQANCIVHEVIEHAASQAKPGMSTLDLDALMVEKLSTYDGASSAFLGYGNYPNVSCISVNETIVHGIPNTKPLEEGDLVTIDFGVYYKGFAGDSAKSFFIGKSQSEEEQRLIQQTQRGLFAGIETMRPGNCLYDLNAAINEVAKENGFGNVRNFSGHGIGRKMHEKPSVFNYVEPREPNVHFQPGLVLALEPMFTLGTHEYVLLEDKWTVNTKDKSKAVHWELSIAVTKEGPRILGHGWENIF